jgi:hypothetical protein
VEIELTMNLTGGFGQFVLPEEIRQVDSVAITMTLDPNRRRKRSPMQTAGR